MDWFGFGDSAHGVLLCARRKLAPEMENGHIFGLLDDLSQGDITDVTDRAARSPTAYPWYDDPELFDEKDRNALMRRHFEETLPALDACGEAAVWYGENAREQCGLRYAAHRLAARGGKLWAVHVNRMPFADIPAPQPIEGAVGVISDNKWASRLFRLMPQPLLKRHMERDARKRWKNRPMQGERQYRGVGECCLEELPYFYAKRRLLPVDERDALAAEWERLTAENAPLRVWENGAVHSAPEDYYDARILAAVPDKPAAAALAVGHVLGKLPVGDLQVFRRIQVLARQGQIKTVTNGATYRDMVICRKG